MGVKQGVPKNYLCHWMYNACRLWYIIYLWFHDRDLRGILTNIK